MGTLIRQTVALERQVSSGMERVRTARFEEAHVEFDRNNIIKDVDEFLNTPVSQQLSVQPAYTLLQHCVIV